MRLGLAPNLPRVQLSKTMDQNKYFSLFACCFCVKGAKEGIIIDSQRGAFLAVPNELIPILNKSNQHKIRDLIEQQYPHLERGILAYFGKLVEMEYGFLTSEPERFPAIDLQWKTPFPLAAGIVEYDFSSASFDLIHCLKLLEEQCCELVQFRFFNQVDVAQLDKTLVQFSQSRFRRFEILMNWQSYKQHKEALNELSETHGRISNYGIFNSPVQESDNKITHYTFPMEPGKYVERVGKSGFLTSLNHYTESLKFNTGLNGKIAIDITGRLMNHPAHSKSFGMIQDTETLSRLLEQDDFLQQQRILKTEVQPCKSCQFRNMCHTVSELIPGEEGYKMAHPCSFDPAANEWRRQTESSLKPA